MHKNCEEQLQVKLWTLEQEIQQGKEIINYDKVKKLYDIAKEKHLEHDFVYDEKTNSKECTFCGLKVENLKKARR